MNKPASKEKNVLITGGTSGLGLELVKLFLKKRYFVVVTGRQLLNLKGNEGKFKLFRVDFSDMTQVAQTMKAILHSIDHFDIIVNNAGILSPPDFKLTINGNEYTFQINFLSHLFINEIILRAINDDRPVRIANVISPVYRLADVALTINTVERDYNPFKAYASSKLYLVLMCEFLKARYPRLNLQCFSFDPGTFSSGIYRMQKKWFRAMYGIASPFMRDPGIVAQALIEILTKEGIENGMICDFKKRTRRIPEIDEQVKVAFRNDCYKRIDHLLKSY